MFFKAINDLVGPNGLVFTLLVFGAYPRITELDALTSSITQRAIAMKKAIDEVQKCTTLQQVNNALNTQNRSSIASMHNLPINSFALVYREQNAGQSGEWKRLYNLVSIQDKSVIIELPHGLTKFRATLIKPYFIDHQQLVLNSSAPTQIPQLKTPHAEVLLAETPQIEAPTAKSSSAPLASLASVKQSRGQPRKYSEQANIIAQSDIYFQMDESNVFIKNVDTPPTQYSASRQKEIAGLLEKGVFKVVISADIPNNTQIFNSHSVDEVKHAGTDKASEKCWLVVQA